jgi:hypothetical protein
MQSEIRSATQVFALYAGFRCATRIRTELR